MLTDTDKLLTAILVKLDRLELALERSGLLDPPAGHPDELLNADACAAILGISTAMVNQHARFTVEELVFPAAVNIADKGPKLRRRADVEEWAGTPAAHRWLKEHAAAVRRVRQ